MTRRRSLALVCALGVAGVSAGCSKKAPRGPAELPQFSDDPRDRKASARHAEKLLSEAHGLSKEKRYNDAARFAWEALQYRSRAFGNHSAVLAPTLVWVSDALIRAGQYGPAFQLATRAKQISVHYRWTEMTTAADRRLGLLTRLRGGARLANLEERLKLVDPPLATAEAERREAASARAAQPAQKTQAFVALPVVTAGHIEGAAATVAALRMRFGECYTRGLMAEPGISGRIELTLGVDANGRVATMAHSTKGNLSQYVIDCVRWVGGQAQFNKPAGGKAELLVPVNFERE